VEYLIYHWETLFKYRLQARH